MADPRIPPSGRTVNREPLSSRPLSLGAAICAVLAAALLPFSAFGACMALPALGALMASVLVALFVVATDVSQRRRVRVSALLAIAVGCAVAARIWWVTHR